MVLGEDFKGQELSNLLWALATLQHPLPRELLREFSEEWCRLMIAPSRSGDPQRFQNLTNTLWAFAKLRVNPGDGALFAVTSELFVRERASFELQHMSSIVVAAAVLQQPLDKGVADLVRSLHPARWLCRPSSMHALLPSPACIFSAAGPPDSALDAARFL
jgi:hypothetical protein